MGQFHLGMRSSRPLNRRFHSMFIWAKMNGNMMWMKCQSLPFVWVSCISSGFNAANSLSQICHAMQYKPDSYLLRRNLSFQGIHRRSMFALKQQKEVCLSKIDWIVMHYSCIHLSNVNFIQTRYTCALYTCIT